MGTCFAHRCLCSAQIDETNRPSCIAGQVPLNERSWRVTTPLLASCSSQSSREPASQRAPDPTQWHSPATSSRYIEFWLCLLCSPFKRQKTLNSAQPTRELHFSPPLTPFSPQWSCSTKQSHQQTAYHHALGSSQAA